MQVLAWVIDRENLKSALWVSTCLVMKKLAIAFIIIGIAILVMSSIRIVIPIVISPITQDINEVINVTPGTRLIISDVNGSLKLVLTEGYSQFLDSINYLSPIFIFVGIMIPIALLAMKRRVEFDPSDPLLFGIMAMLAVSLLFALPIPTPIVLNEASKSIYLLLGINAYTGLSSITYLISAVLLAVNTWLYRGQQATESPYPDIDQLISMTVMFKNEEAEDLGNEKDEQ